jgi:hypothetical protein
MSTSSYVLIPAVCFTAYDLHTLSRFIRLPFHVQDYPTPSTESSYATPRRRRANQSARRHLFVPHVSARSIHGLLEQKGLFG